MHIHHRMTVNMTTSQYGCMIKTDFSYDGLLPVQIKEETFKMECEVEEQKFFSEISKSKYPLVLVSKLSSNILQKYKKKKKDRKDNLSSKNLKAKIVVRKKKSLGNPVRTIPKKLKLGEIPLDVNINNKILKKNTSPRMKAQPLKNTDIDYKITPKDSKLFKCSDCGFECKWKANLNRHMLTHSDLKLFNCSVCNYRCKQKRYLKDHMLTHSNEKFYKCDECNFECKQKCHLKRHMLTHSNVKLFKCSECSYECKLRENLKAHMLTHTNIKLYECSECHYTCNHRGHMKSHMLTHTNVKLYKCSIPFQMTVLFGKKYGVTSNFFSHFYIDFSNILMGNITTSIP
ncbi:Zinc finger protein [Armadillidium nasatum]|uniref:Zinc finger protein n=1 Tax=Armadillidium nasatum TaxID=96803 RepID=A0A5N5T5K5_9CRUS|nr:Zinc finger protein [Armadillidium nasatum]